MRIKGYIDVLVTCEHSPRVPGFAWCISYTRKGAMLMPLDLSLTTEEKVLVRAVPMTPHGSPAQVDGEVSFLLTSGDMTFERVDQLSGFLVSSTTPGDSTFLVEADADLGSGVVTIADTITCHVSNPLATSLGLTAEQPVPKV